MTSRRGFLAGAAGAAGAAAAFSPAQQMFLMCVRKPAPSSSLPYDAEVEYIERDFGVPWVVDGTAKTTISTQGFDLSEYCVAGETQANMTRKLAATYCVYRSFVVNRAVMALYVNAIGNVAVMCTSTGAYGGKGGSNFTDTAIAIGETPGDYHTTEIVPDGSGGFTNKVDGQTIGTGSSSSTSVLKHFFILTQLTPTAQTPPVIRVKSVRLGDDVELVPVRKGSAVGFYNRVDGHLFLEEQACLAAGPDK